MSRRPAYAACALLVMFLLAACGAEESPSAPAAWSTLDTLTPQAPSPGAQPIIRGLSDVRVLGRAPWFRLTSQAGKPFGTDDLRGRVWVGTFMFTRCRATCPLQAERMVALQSQLSGLPWHEDVHLVSFSVDPERDTPAILKSYADSYQADLRFWTFLTGDRRRIWKISTAGFHLPAGEDPANEAMPIAHSAKFVLVDRRGLIRGYYDSQSDEGMAALEAALEKVVGEPKPTFEIPERPPWLASRAQAQIDASADWNAFHDFGFRDELVNSEITFSHRMVDAVGRDYIGVHYDHGNGLAVADVDGDGHLDVFFSNQMGSNSLWRNRGDGTFEDITERAGVAMKHEIGVSVSFADTDNDGDPDLFLTTLRGGNRLFVNDGTGRFEDATEASGLGYVGHSSSADFFDYDADGLLDLYVTNVGTYTQNRAIWLVNDSTSVGREPGLFKFFQGEGDAFAGHLKADRDESNILYRNLGGNRFKDVTAEVGLVDGTWSGDATPIDANRDGWIDLYVLSMQGHDEYYENQGGKKFVKRSRELFPKTPWGAMGVKVFDFDNDGDFDLYITDMHSDMTDLQAPEAEKSKSKIMWPESIMQSGGKSIWGNAFFRSDGADKFSEISDEIGAENYWPWGLSVGDLNADGFLDAFVTSSMNYPFRYGVNSVLLNEGGSKFLDSEFVLGVEPRADRLYQPWFELDCKGRGASHRLCQKNAGATSVVVYGAVGSRASVIFDLEGDGDLDIITNESHTQPMVLVSNLTDRTTVNYLKVALEGTKSNRDGLGAVVRVHVGDRVLMQCHDGQSGYMSQSSCPLYFGCGDAKSVSKIEVTWPSGIQQVVAGPIEVGQLLEIKEAQK